MFHYSSYWHMWSRVLTSTHKGRGGNFVEVNLTPIRNWQEEVAGIRIRVHCTSRGRDDKTVATLPPEVRAKMVKNLGEELTQRLLTEDFLSQIDWERYQKACNGGANLADIKKG